MTKPLVKVSWIDAQDHPETWVDEEEAHAFGDEECLVVSVGWLIRKTDKYLTLGSDWDETDKNYGTVRKIAMGMVKSIDEIVELDKK